MIRFIVQSILTILGNAVGLLVAAMVIPGFHIDGFGFFVSIGFFTVAQIILAPFIFKLAIQYVPAFRGGIALITTFVVLLLTSWFTSGLRIEGMLAWVIAPMVVWLAAVLAGIFLPMFLFKKALQNRNETES